MSSKSNTIRVGTRGSLLARMQSQLVAGELEKRHPGLQVELVIVTTSGDVIVDKPLNDVGGKGLFTKELELALLAREVDMAVHSYKDVPVTMPLVEQSGLVIAATPQREDPRDVLALRSGETPMALKDLRAGARVGTGSLRRRCQIAARRPDLAVQPIRGNIDTRLRKLEEGQHDAVVLAMAGLRRAGLFDGAHMQILEVDEMLPAPGQGALALQCRREDARTVKLLSALHDEETEVCVDAERALVAKLGGDCHSPIAALGTIIKEVLRLRARVGARDGGVPVIEAEASGARSQWMGVVEACFKGLVEQNVEALLRGGR